MIANLRFRSNLKPNDLRKLYRIHRITRQRLVSQLKPTRNCPVDEQIAKLKDINETFRYHLGMGREVFVYDESVFVPKNCKMEHWAPSGDPLMTKSKYANGKCVVVCGFISVESGKAMMKIAQKRAFTAIDIKRFMKELGNANKNDCAAFGDNASIHVAAMESAAQNGVHMFMN
jgi:hypothetical protein